jgi:uncharacterized protein YndB with AHSA1/START domain
MNQIIKLAAVRKTLVVRAPPEAAFRVFTEGFDRWWPRSHHIGKSELAKAVIEPRRGGRWYEICVDGSECEWGEVLAWDPPRRLLLAWRLDARWEYDPDLLTEVEVRFTPAGDGQTQVDFEHRGFENMGAGGEAARASVDGPNGWGAILAEFKMAAEAPA